ncbi:MAG: peptidoglycan editing factor PgeF [Burkholderiales bacterium]|nr:peptidoglycan editing factor PgeF [Burkholderiales bacterium]
MLSERDGLAVEGLGAGVRAWMSLRAGGVSQPPFDALNLGVSVGDDPAAVQANREAVATLMQAPLVMLRQVHGTQCLRLDVAAEQNAAQAADAAVLRRRDRALGIQVADCLPVLFSAVDPKGQAQAVAGAHAGWRGLAGGVLEQTVAQLRAAAPGCELRAWLGPCIGPQAYEVGEDVMQQFGGEGPLMRYTPRPDGSPRWHADLQGLAVQRLQQASVDRIERCQACTFSEPSRFFSFRRDGARSGRMAAFIRLL